MANCQKYNKATCGHMFKHYERAKLNGEYIKFHNQNIDTSRTHLNYNLAPTREINQGEFIRQRCEEVYCLNRKDVNVMCSWVITAPQDLPTKELKQFFQASYNFMAKRYGQENIISSYVHMDEITPHMHFAFVPVIYDEKKERLKVSAKDVINRTELQVFHKEFQTHVEQVLGHSVSVLNEATIDGNKSITELKRRTSLEAQKLISKAQLEIEGMENKIKALNVEYKAKKAFIDEANRIGNVNVMYPSEVKITEKGILKKEKYVTVPAEMWEARHISVHQEEVLDRATRNFENSIRDFQNRIQSKNPILLQNKIDELEHKNKALIDENKKLKREILNTDSKLKKLQDSFRETIDWIHSDRSLIDSYYAYKKSRETENLSIREKEIPEQKINTPIKRKFNIDR